MRYIKTSLYTAVFFIGVTIGCNSEIKNSAGYFNDDEAPQTNIYFGDPHVFVDEGTYYIYGTGEESDTGIEVYKSDDMKNWIGPVGATNGFALHKDDVIGDRWFWAPEVYRFGEIYYMFFSVEEQMSVAFSDSPTGPFVQEEEFVLADFNAIDNHLFIDDDGTHYIYFAKFEDGLEIWGAEFEEDFSGLKEDTMERLLYQSQDWEQSQAEPVGTVNEGAEVIKYEGLYYMFYSANHYASPDYGIGFAYADHPMGPWTKADENPILQNPEGLAGTGHCMLFKGLDGQKYISYHSHYDIDEVQPRRSFINPVEFVKLDEEDRYTIEIRSPRMELMHRPPEN